MALLVTQTEKQMILDGLTSSDGEVRRLSVEQLPQLEIEEAVPYLAQRLGDEVWRVRKAAVECLVRCIDHPPVQEILVASLADGEDPGRRNAAFEALVACGSRVTSRLVDELSNPDVDVRKLVVDAVAAIADPDTRGPLAKLMADPDTNVRAATVEALGMVGGPDEVNSLLTAVQSEDEALLVRLSGLRALTRLEAGVSVEALGSALDESLLCPAALNLLGLSEDRLAVEVLVKALGRKGRSDRDAAMGALLQRLGRVDGIEAVELRSRICEAARADPDLVDGACRRLASSNLATRLVLIQFLGLLEDSRVVIPVLRAGRDEAIEELSDATLESLGDLVPGALDEDWEKLESDVKRRACTALGRVGGAIAKRRLVESLCVDDSELRCAAANALGRGLFLECLPDLVRRLEIVALDQHRDSQEEITSLTVAIVEMAERPEAVETGFDVQVIESLSSRLGGAPEPVRLAIAQVLARVGRQQDEDVLAYLLKDESPAVRRAAVKALDRFDFDYSQEPLRLALGDESEWVRTAAASVLGEVDSVDAIEDLERMTHDEEPRVVAVALRALGKLCRRLESGFDRVYPMIEAGLTRPAIVALASLEALAELGGSSVSKLALGAVGRAEPEVVRAAMSCVDQHGSEEDLAHLMALIPHPDWSVRAEVAGILSRRKCRKALPAFLRRLELEDDPFVRESILDVIHRLEE